MSSDKENEYFVDGLTEEILNRLAPDQRVAQFPAAPRRSPLKARTPIYAKSGPSVRGRACSGGQCPQIGRPVADHLSAHSHCRGGFHLWSQTFDRKLDDVFAIQDEIARAIADALSTPLGLDASRSARSGKPKDMEVYDRFLQARALLAQRSPENLRRAIELLTAAVDRDPGFASGWAALAQARALSSYYHQATSLIR